MWTLILWILLGIIIVPVAVLILAIWIFYIESKEMSKYYSTGLK